MKEEKVGGRKAGVHVSTQVEAREGVRWVLFDLVSFGKTRVGGCTVPCLTIEGRGEIEMVRGKEKL